jgi:hypothetical protein
MIVSVDESIFIPDNIPEKADASASGAKAEFFSFDVLDDQFRGDWLFHFGHSVVGSMKRL